MSDIYCGYVKTDQGEFLLQIPVRDTQWGFVLASDDQTWPGGVGIAKTWETVKPEDVPKKVRRRLDPVLEDMRPKRGRPPEAEDGARSVELRVRVSAAEKRRIEEMAAESKMDVSTYVRGKLL